MRLVRAQARLPAEEGPGRHAQALQGDGQEADRDLLAGGHHLIVFGGVVGGGIQLLDPAHELVRGTGHGGEHDGHALAPIHMPLDPAGHVADAV